MQADLYKIDGKVEKKVEVPKAFSEQFKEHLVRRALLAEQSLKYQPQAHSVMAGLNTSAVYVGEYNSYRTGRHMGMAIRPRQKLAGGAQGDVRRIPSAVKGRRAHPHKLEKIIVERINATEYRKALESAIGATGNKALVEKKHLFKGSLPIIIDNQIEGITKTKELIKVLSDLGLSQDIEKSHDPKGRRGHKRSSVQRHYRNSVLIVVKPKSKVEVAARNIPGVDVVSVDQLKITFLAPGAMPRLAIWSENALNALEEEIKKARL